MVELKKVFCCYNFLNFQCSNIFLTCSLLVFQSHLGSKAVSLKRSATSRPLFLDTLLIPLSLENKYLTPEKYFLTANAENYSKQSTIGTSGLACESNLSSSWCP